MWILKKAPLLCFSLCLVSAYKYTAISGDDVYKDSVILTAVARSRIKCIAECSKRNPCESASFNTITRACTLYKTFPRFIAPESSKGTLTYCMSGKCTGVSVYQGCFQDQLQRSLDDYETKTKTMTIRKCLDICNKRMNKYAGLQYGKECFCGDNIPPVKVPISECNMSCNGDPTEMCGGFFRNSVYLVSPW